jgi:hypothetical protein
MGPDYNDLASYAFEERIAEFCCAVGVSRMMLQRGGYPPIGDEFYKS